MSDESRPEAPSGAPSDAPDGPKRKGTVARKHTVGRVILISAIVLALVTGLSVVYFVRHLNGNIESIDLGDLGGDRPEKIYNGNGEALNILVMGSDSRDCEGCGVDNVAGGTAPTPPSSCTCPRTAAARTPSRSRATRSSTDPSAATRPPSQR